MRLYLACLLLGGIAFTGVLGARRTSCNCGWVNKGRIVGGQEAPKNKYPLIVALVDPTDFQFCGGTILTPWHVITAAHCTQISAKEVLVKVGTHNKKNPGPVYPVAKIINHESYNERQAVNDISLLVTAKQIQFNQQIGPACLPDKRLSLTGQTIKALGWGDTSAGGRDSNVLLEVDLKVISAGECQKKWAKQPFKPREETNMCTFTTKKDTCQGDSGGPLIWLDPETGRYTLAALVSYGNGCANSYPAVNTDVSAYLGWINKHIKASKKEAAACRKV